MKTKVVLFPKLINLIIITFGFSIFYLIILNASHDIPQYKILLRWIKDFQLLGFSFNEVYENPDIRTEYGSFIIFWYLAKAFSIVDILVIVTFTTLFVKYLLFKKYFDNYNIAFIFYILCFGFVWDGNQIRVAIALCFIIYLFLSNPSIVRGLFLILISTLFHLSSIFFLVSYSHIILAKIFYNNVLFYVFSIMIAVILIYMIKLTVINYGYFNYYMGSPSYRLNVISGLTLLHLCIIGCFIFNYKFLTLIQKQSLTVLIVGLLFFIIFIDYDLVSSRMRELSFVSLIPLYFSKDIIKNRFFNLARLLLFIFFISRLYELQYYLFVNPLPGLYYENYMDYLNS